MSKKNPNTNDNDLVALPEISSEVGAGAIVTWRRVAPVKVKKLEAAVIASGLERKLFPDNPRPVDCLSRGMEAQSSKRRFLRALPGVKRGTGWALVEEAPVLGEDVDGTGTGTLAHKVIVKGWMEDGAFNVTTEDETYGDVAEAVYEAAELAAGEFTGGDLGGWLADLAIWGCQGVPLRQAGGCYYIPEVSMQIWHERTAVLRAAGRQVIVEVPAVKTDDVLAAVTEALELEVTRAVGLASRYTHDPDGVFTKRGVRSQRTNLETVAAKCKKYSDALGLSLQSVLDSLEKVTEELVVAAVMAGVVEE